MSLEQPRGNALEDAIRDAVNGGDMSDHPLRGRPLQLDENPFTPSELRMAYKILQDNRLAPDWIIEGKALDALRARIDRELALAVRCYRGRLADARRVVEEAERQLLRDTARAAWRRAQQRLSDLIAQYNRRVLTYNLKVPPVVGQRGLLKADELIQQALRRASQLS